MKTHALKHRGAPPKWSARMIAGAALLLLPAATWAAEDAWVPDHAHATFFRNNTLQDFTVQAMSQVSTTSGCFVAPEDYKFTNGTQNVPVGAGRVTEVLNIDDTDHCLESGDVWRFVLAMNGCPTTHEFRVRGDGALSVRGIPFVTSPLLTSLDFCGTLVPTRLFARGSYYESGVYITLGVDPYSGLGPTRQPSDPDQLTVTSYNTYLGTASKPERCERADAMARVLPQLDTDVLVLEEMNLREADCFDGVELAAYLWTGDMTSTNDDHIENDSYARSTSGSGTSPNGDDKYGPANGAFPYISQFVSGIPVNGFEFETGGVVILSKYPVTMIANRTYGDRSTPEQKGFIVARIHKSVLGAGARDYYIVATHTDSDADYRQPQIWELSTQLSQLVANQRIPAGARVILAGDLNTTAKQGELSPLAVDVQYSPGPGTESYGQQTLASYYPYSRDSRVNFYHNTGSTGTIDWVLPMSVPTGGYDFADPRSFSWHVFPIRETRFKFAELSDHFAVTGRFTY
ncbi:endonuclease/exonuclease/phosphatase family protein [Hyalangium gracile]|uniref:endonuclease/exonuclease/phosphatase family protein n=1 Tax=Hyalangium gracile TaxID=394092 RepID=UPI001CCA06CE|nr:endonuclease/exonuclease/phosphatase family protein [Hyalangium gracile]